MIATLTGITAADVAAALVRLRDEGGVSVLGHVLTLVAMVHGEADIEPAVTAARRASLEHPCRVVILLSTIGDGRSELSAEIRVGSDAGAGDLVVLRAAGGAALSPATLIAPLVVPDSPMVAWWPTEPPDAPAEHPVGALAQRRITDALVSSDPAGTLRRLATSYVPGDTDLSWARSTPWRALLAAMLDDPPEVPVEAAWVSGQRLRPTVELVGAWLASRLDCPVRVRQTPSPTLTEVGLKWRHGALTLTREGEGSMVVLRRTGVPDQGVHLPVRSLADCLMEDLRYMAPDPVYGRALGALGSLALDT